VIASAAPEAKKQNHEAGEVTGKALVSRLLRHPEVLTRRRDSDRSDEGGKEDVRLDENAYHDVLPIMGT